ncbi:uncharacterized protein [Amphiura filiformis]|uniref:uncharacterized protein n=1 Tax=Amphiura filiformis TaxID=82378 RepID=UPI003B20E882
MAEGPWLRNWGHMTQQFEGNKIEMISGTTKLIDKEMWQRAYFSLVQVYGKQMFIKLSHSCAGDEDKSIWLRYHFQMHGRLKIGLKLSKEQQPRLVFHFQDRKYLAFFGGSLKIVAGPCEDTKTDILSETFDREQAAEAVRQGDHVCNILLDQTHFSGVGNIIMNEVLYNCKIHPQEIGENLSRTEAENLVNEVVKFSNEWLDWELSDHSCEENLSDQMKVYWKFTCPLGHKTKRGWFKENELKWVMVWCPRCQQEKSMPIQKLGCGKVVDSKSSNGEDASSAEYSGGEVQCSDSDGTGSYDWNCTLDELPSMSNEDTINTSDEHGNDVMMYDNMVTSDSGMASDGDLEVVSVIDRTCVIMSNYEEKKPKVDNSSKSCNKSVKVLVEQSVLELHPKLNMAAVALAKKLSAHEIQRRTCKYKRCNTNLKTRSFNSKWHRISHSRYNKHTTCHSRPGVNAKISQRKQEDQIARKLYKAQDRDIAIKKKASSRKTKVPTCRMPLKKWRVSDCVKLSAQDKNTTMKMVKTPSGTFVVTAPK